jgi:hypothetical protein
VERQNFARAKAEVFWPGSGSGYVNSYKMLPKLKLKLKFVVEFKNYFFVAVYFKEPFYDHFVVKKHENFLKP